jgi:hypothetical protein
MKNKILSGGDEPLLNVPLENSFTISNQIQTYLSIIILGYFGIKIVYGSFFNFYPQKYYYRNIDISTNNGIRDRGDTENITLNAYMPGVWNNEMTDFITLVVLCAVVFVFTNVSAKSFVNSNGNVSLSFLFGYIIGLGYPPIYNIYSGLYNREVTSSSMIRYIYLVIFVAFIVFVITLNYVEANKISSVHRINYSVYACVIVLLFFGLIVAKKSINTYSTVTYFYNDGEQCTFSRNGILQSSGDKLNITIPFASFIILLFFSYEPQELSMKNLYTFMYGILLGILVSSISYFGIEYFLLKEPQKQCQSLNECVLKEMPAPLEEVQNEIASLANSEINKIKSLDAQDVLNNRLTPINILRIVIIIIIVIIVIFLIFNYRKK